MLTIQAVCFVSGCSYRILHFKPILGLDLLRFSVDRKIIILGTFLDHLVGHGVLGVGVGPVADAVHASKVLVVPDTKYTLSDKKTRLCHSGHS